MLDMKKSQLSKMSKGDTVQIKPEMVGSGMPFKLSKEKVKKLMKSKMSGKASRIKLTEDEMTGSGIMKKTRRKRMPRIIEMLEPTETLMRTQRYNTSMVDTILPASRPLIQIGNAQNGDLFLKSSGR